MEELIINCGTGKQTRRAFTPAEIQQRQAEAAQAQAAELAQRKRQLSAELIEINLDLVEANKLVGEKVIDQAIVDEMVARRQEITAQLSGGK